jgi:uncharacterized delta-60 repeat protein
MKGSMKLQALEPRRLLAVFLTDTSWGGGGFVDEPAANDHLTDTGGLTVQPADGKLLVMASGPNLAELLRYNSDGSLDGSFASNGRFVLSNTGTSVAPVVTDSGQILISNNGGTTRLSSAGVVDMTFGSSGTVATGELDDLKPAPGGKILALAGTTLTRLNADGTPDTTFGGGDGTVAVPSSFGRLTVQHDGQVLFFPDVGLPLSEFVRFHADGSPDASFQQDLADQGFVDINSVSAESDDQLVVAGVRNIQDPGGDSMNSAAIVRLNTDGSIDSSYRTDDVDSLISFQLSATVGAIDAQDRAIVLASESSSVQVLRLHPSGPVEAATQDATLPGGAIPYRMALAPDGKVLIGGTSAYQIGRIAPHVAMVDEEKVLIVQGSGGDDVITVSAVGQTLRVTEGSDSEDFATSSVPAIAVQLSDGNDSFTDTATVRVSVSGDAGNDTIQSGGAPDLLDGGDGDDRLDGGEGDDAIFGGLGNDVLVGEDGDDWLSGDAGKDSLYGGAGGDVLLGGDNSDLLSGGGGKDKLAGEAGPDRLYAGAGDDQLNGGGANDRLFGGDGHDRLTGAQGDDFLDGGDGADVIAGSRGADSATGGDALDQILGVETIL